MSDEAATEARLAAIRARFGRAFPPPRQRRGARVWMPTVGVPTATQPVLETTMELEHSGDFRVRDTLEMVAYASEDMRFLLEECARLRGQSGR